MALSFIVWEIWRVACRKWINFYTPPVFRVPAAGDAVRISWRTILVKLEWLGYRAVKKLWQYIKPFRYNTRTWRTDERTDVGYRRTERISILYRASKTVRSYSCWNSHSGSATAEIIKVKEGHTAKERRRGAHLLFIGRWARIYTSLFTIKMVVQLI